MSYFAGCAKIQVNVDQTLGMNLQGYAIKEQKIQTLGTLMARAFVIAEDASSSKAHRTAIVVADIWSCTEEIQRRAIGRLHVIAPNLRDLFDATNVQISGTHTHSAPAGISKWPLYNFSSGGFSVWMADSYADAMARAIQTAYASARDCDLQLYKTTLENCGANRSLPAYLNNPAAELARYATSVDEDMTILCLRPKGEARVLGTLAWHAIHGTDIGQDNTTIDGDNKGRASKLLEDEGVPVAAFANANAGDVSGNVALNSLPPSDPSRADIHAAQMARAVKDQVLDPAMPHETLSGGIRSALRVVDMSNVHIAATGNRTYRATLGLSTFAGSTEDSVPPLPANQLREGIRHGDASMVEAAIQAAILAGGSDHDITLELARYVLSGEADASTAAIFAGIAALSLATLGAFGVVTALALEGLQYAQGGLNAQSFFDLTDEERNGHAPKPITMNVSNIAPHDLPLQIIRIGDLAILGVPAELTTMAGRRLRERVLTVLNALPPEGLPARARTVVTTGYANAYSQYVTTREEYDMQHYEGSSTLFGPHTLEAYLQEFSNLALDMAPVDQALASLEIWQVRFKEFMVIPVEPNALREIYGGVKLNRSPQPLQAADPQGLDAPMERGKGHYIWSRANQGGARVVHKKAEQFAWSGGGEEARTVYLIAASPSENPKVTLSPWIVDNRNQGGKSLMTGASHDISLADLRANGAESFEIEFWSEMTKFWADARRLRFDDLPGYKKLEIQMAMAARKR